MNSAMTISDWARSVGISRQSAHEAIKRCEIPVTAGKVDPLVATTLYRARTRIRSNTRQAATAASPAAAPPVTPPPATPSATPTAADHDLRRKKADADMAELEVRRKAGQLVDRASAERAVFDAFRELRDATGNALRDAADRLVGLTDVREIEHRLLDAQRAAFEAFEARMQRRLQEAAES